MHADINGTKTSLLIMYNFIGALHIVICSKIIECLFFAGEAGPPGPAGKLLQASIILFATLTQLYIFSPLLGYYL